MFFFALFYILFAFLIIYPPVEFVTAGLTIPGIFARCLGSEGESFIEYHRARVIVTLLVHSFLPLGFVLGLFLSDPDVFPSLFLDPPYALLWRCYFTTALAIPIIVALKLFDWWRDSWARHPVFLNLGKFTDSDHDFKALVSSVNIEFRRFDKVAVHTNATSRAYVTDTWIIKIGMYNVYFAHQTDAMLIVNNSDTYQFTPTGSGEMQFINIKVKSTRPNRPTFSFRLIAQDFKELQDKVRRPIIILPNIVFHKTLIDKFIEVFREQTSLNEVHIATHPLELCIGCMQERSNVKLNKKCLVPTEIIRPGEPSAPECTQCNCRPMWCIDCMARWFASRQDPDQTDKWLSNKCTCPVCRAVFCLLDVNFVREPPIINFN